MSAYQIFTDAAADLCPELLDGLPSVEVIPMPVVVGGCEYTYGAAGGISTKDLYAMERARNFAATSQINPGIYWEYFEPVLQEGRDILYLCFSSGLSGTCQAAQICTEELQGTYPQRRIICIDTLCASIGEGFLVREAAQKQAEGLTLDELSIWVTDHRLEVGHWFTVDVFDHLRHGGRVSAAAAAAGTLLQVKPLLCVNAAGRLVVTEKPRGRKRAIEALLGRLEACWRPGVSPLIVIGHGDVPDSAEQLRTAVIAQFPDADIHTTYIGSKQNGGKEISLPPFCLVFTHI